MQQQIRKTSFLKALFGARRQETTAPKKAIERLRERQLCFVAGGTDGTSTPRRGW
jgi:hypothetical protein